MTLSQRETIRYDRQMRIPQIGTRGQEMLKEACIAIAGAGGLGSPAALYLAAAGVGTIRVIDRDRVETGNLNRQILHSQADEGTPKVLSARETLARLNPDIVVEVCEAEITPENSGEFFSGCHGIVDALDSLDARYLLNRTAFSLGIPLFHGAVNGFEGQAMTVIPGESACLCCLYKEPQPEMDRPVTPVIGVTPGVIGAIQAAEAVKHIIGKGSLLTNRLLRYDGLGSQFQEFRINPRLGCSHCSLSTQGEAS